MSKVEETWIGQLGLTNEARAYLKKHGGSANASASAFAKDEHCRATINAAGGRMKVMSKDFHEFLSAEALDKQAEKFEKEKFALMAKTEPGENAQAPVLQLDKSDRIRLSEAAQNAIALAEMWFPLAQRFLRILDDDLESYEEERDQPTRRDSEGNLIYPEFPVAFADVVRKAVLSSIEVVGELKRDQSVKQWVSTEQITVNQGMSLAEFHKALFGTCKRLGVTQSKALEAYSLYLADKSGTDIIDAVPLPPEPQWRKDQRAESAARADPIISDAVASEAPPNAF